MYRHILILLFAVLATFYVSSAYAADVSKVDFEVSEKQTRLVLDVSTSKKPNVFLLAGEKPRLVIDVIDADLTKGLRKQSVKGRYFTGDRGVEKIRFASRGESNLRLVADLESGVDYVSNSFEDGKLSIVFNTTALNPKEEQSDEVKSKPSSDIFIDKPKPEKASETETEKPTDAKTTVYVENIPAPTLKKRSIVRRYRKPVIVIDPGHGGYDPGAIGVKKVKEENVTLLAARELKSQLLATRRYHVVLTREKDVYVALEERVRIARKAEADLFISIHADSLGSASTRGASVYTLADRAQKRTNEIISSQNWVLGVDLNEQSDQVGDILVDLAQRKTLTQSSIFADSLISELSKHSKMVGNSHRRAGLYVLLAPDVPAVLLEMGYLSNAQDERLLNSSHHRKNLMKAVTRSINVYFKSQTQLQASR